MHYAVFGKGGIFVRGHPVAGRNAAALVDGNVDNDRTLSHGLDHILRYELRSLGTGH
jgi:hypothetical protein